MEQRMWNVKHSASYGKSIRSMLDIRSCGRLMPKSKNLPFNSDKSLEL